MLINTKKCQYIENIRIIDLQCHSITMFTGISIKIITGLQQTGNVVLTYRFVSGDLHK